MTQSIPQQPSRRHHYIPAFYTKQWATDGELVEYRKVHHGKLVHRWTAPDGTGWKKDLYAIEGLEGIDQQQVEERYFRTLDNDAATLVQHFMNLDGRTPIHPDDQSVWITFLMSLLYRTPEDISRMRAHFIRAMNDISPEMQQRWLSVRQPHQPIDVREVFLKTYPGERDISFFKGFINLMQSDLIGNEIIRMKWRVFDLKHAAFPLLTSDRPVIQSNGLRAPNGHIAIPLSPRHLFLAAKDAKVLHDISVLGPKLLAKQVNLNVVQAAHRFVYASSKSQTAFIRNHMGKNPRPRLIDAVVRDR